MPWDHLKEGIGLRGYGQRDPLMEYKRESFDMFEAMWDRIEEEIVRLLFLLQPVREPRFEPRFAARPSRLSFNDPTSTPSVFDGAAARRRSPGENPREASTRRSRPSDGPLRKWAATRRAHVVVERNTRNAAEQLDETHRNRERFPISGKR